MWYTACGLADTCRLPASSYSLNTGRHQGHGCATSPDLVCEQCGDTAKDRGDSVLHTPRLVVGSMKSDADQVSAC